MIGKTIEELNFRAPVRIGDPITARAAVIEIVPDKNRVRLKTDCINQEGIPVIDGEAVVSPPKAKKNNCLKSLQHAKGWSCGWGRFAKRY